MSWNGNDKKDPWGRDDAPPEIDEVIKKAKETINSIFGGGNSSEGGSSDGFSIYLVKVIIYFNFYTDCFFTFKYYFFV